VVTLQLELLAKPSYFLEGPRVGQSDGRLIGKRSEPLELVLSDRGRTEHR